MIQKAVPVIQLIVHGDSGLAVVKGAVRFRHKPDIISYRVMDYTYGISRNDFYYEANNLLTRKYTNMKKRR
ncbi:hypothetical protein DPMN_192759 [Dreissena polymorpha]|uniref:Uncharacterized protein n=1 Tax=Dreissena polymorpha TaxID=45954 RepID=A0A9D3Y354_DREPO|nr:hypothetical protein DPMN_192759 [Dreissena polymorpha]